MPLPDLIEIAPLKGPVHSRITVPGSKSITNRALVLAALADGETSLEGALWSEDTQVMVDCLQELGFMVNVERDHQEPCNRTITVYGLGGEIPPGGTEDQPLDLFVGNAGTAARFLTAMVCLGKGVYRLHGVPRMHERPQAALIKALRDLGYRIDSPNEKLPAIVHGTGPRKQTCRVSIEQSSQFASALLLCADHADWEIIIEGVNAEESPYVAMTRQLISRLNKGGTCFTVEPDTSSGSYFWGASWLLNETPSDKVLSPVTLWPDTLWQIDQAFPNFLPFPDTISRESDLGDSIMTGIALAPLAPSPVTFTHLGRLRLQECERVKALKTELTKCGAKVEEEGDSLIITPSKLHGAEIETYNDHRMAMCFSILGLKIEGIRIKNPACVKKTFPNFYQKLAQRPPGGLGATIFTPTSGEPLAGDDLFASD